MNDLVTNILPRLSDNERLVLGLPVRADDILDQPCPHLRRAVAGETRRQMMRNGWQSRLRGSWRWEDLPKKPDRWWLQSEYRQIKNGIEVWRSPHVNGYQEKVS